MDLVDKLQNLLPEFRKSGKDKTEFITIDGISAQLALNKQANGIINAWFKFQNFDHGVVFTDEKTKKDFDALINKYCYKSLITCKEGFTYEAIIREGIDYVGIVSPKFFVVGPFEDDFRVKFAKDLLSFYQNSCDKSFEDRF
ncbi:MAG: hypothetical protein V1839_00005 [archaeon]